MSFLSFAFIIFFPVVFIGYWVLQYGSLRQQNLFLLLASYIFYAWGDWRFLALLIANSFVTFIVGRAIQNSLNVSRRKTLLMIGITFVVGVLGFFKYFNFFADSFNRFFGLIGLGASIHTFKLILPLGISYFTFKSMSYMIEVYRGKLNATDDSIAYFAYIGFFPQLVAGPIDRPSNLLYQIMQPRQMSLQAIYLGAKQGLWGMFKKLVVAGTLVKVVDPIFANYAQRSGPELIMGAAFFSIQIYGDFSGYTDIANGCARALGFQPQENFTRPYFSRDLAEFWRRWHISLMSWFRDYIFYPLGGGLGSTWKAIRNTLVVFLISGLWHGANSTFVIWGLFHGLLLLPFIFGVQKTHTKKVAYKRLLPKLDEVWKMTVTFAIVTWLWVIFRSDTVAQAVGFQVRCVTSFSLHPMTSITEILRCILIAGAMVLVEWQKRKDFTPLDIKCRHRSVRWLVYSLVVVAIIFLGDFNETPFLYSQF